MKKKNGMMRKLKDWLANFKYLLTGYYIGRYQGKGKENR